MLTEAKLRTWLTDVRRGRLSTAEVVRRLRRFPTDDLGFARLDSHRSLRRGLPEVILCSGKAEAHVLAIAKRFAGSGELTLLTRLDPDLAQRLQRAIPGLRYEPLARLGYWVPPGWRPAQRGLVAVLTGGTADIGAAEEAARTLELLGSRVERLFDVGVAGLHRLLRFWDTLQRARVLVVAAGMEGALASVASGLVRCPVIALPTSVGYGASFEGLAALLAMLNSCSPGVGVVNIDNGFGAGYLAHVINCPPQAAKTGRAGKRRA